MNLWQSVFLGVVEGLTEFLPVSSTFHLILASRFLQLSNTAFGQLFEVVIQSGAVLALLVIYTKTFLTNRRLDLYVFLSFLPTALVGYLLYPMIKQVFFTHTSLQYTVFIVVGLLFLLFEYSVSRGWFKLHRTNSTMKPVDALLIGLAQSLSVIPGFSRSGSVMLFMLVRGFRRDEAAVYTFLLSVPTILSAGALDLYENQAVLLENSQNITVLLIGAVTAFITAYFVVNWFLKFLHTHTLKAFGWYRIILGMILLLLR